MNGTQFSKAVKEYIKEINNQYKTGIAREHSYRPALQVLLQNIFENYTVTNEPARISCGAPDYIITDNKTSVPIAFIEAKDINDNDLDGRNIHKEQFSRYKNSLSSIIFTDYLDFHLYIKGEFIKSVRLADITNNQISLINNSENDLSELLSIFISSSNEKITSADKLARQMADKARFLSQVIEKALSNTDYNDDNSNLYSQMQAFKNYLIHDLTVKSFADIYSQTIAYGMFAARLHDTTPENFSRQEAANLIPKTNPFLRKLFQSIAAFDLDARISWIVDDLAGVFAKTDMEKVMHSYETTNHRSDIMIHFYEDFLAYYDATLRKSKGVWYTPQSVVSFIVRAVDEILIKDFNLPMGLADYSMVEKQVENPQWDGKNKKNKFFTKKFHKVQILDPATGTGTFLAQAIEQIFKKFENNKGLWQDYAEKNLLPRLNGFEILMASYAVAHLKLDMVLQQTGYKHTSDKRIHVYLTNSLQEHHHDAYSLFAQWLSQESNEANQIKKDTPVMVMIGNPPYSISSSNNGKWITDLVCDYKKDLNERNIQPLSDDYIKFIRLGHHYIQKNGEGILAYISNNSFIDGIIHRQMRKSLQETFDKIYILNLHGNSRKKETCPDGSKDENVFDIMQGVSINIFVKLPKK